MKSIIMAGATGLVGKAVLDLLAEQPQDRTITVLTRRPIVFLDGRRNFHQQTIDFESLRDVGEHIRGDIFICTLGSTIKKAGSKERFAAIDHGYPLGLARMAVENGTRQMILVSSVGANVGASNHYLRTKGRLETELAEVGFAGLHILRPSLLLGKREEFRLGEEIVKKIARATAFMTPSKYKPVSAVQLARKIMSIAERGRTGTHIYEGKNLY